MRGALGVRGALGRRRRERGGTYWRRIEAGEKSLLRDGENLWCYALPSPHLYCVVGSAGWVIRVAEGCDTGTCGLHNVGDE